MHDRVYVRREFDANVSDIAVYNLYLLVPEAILEFGVIKLSHGVFLKNGDKRDI
jgi:hypothetical protein